MFWKSQVLERSWYARAMSALLWHNKPFQLIIIIIWSWYNILELFDNICMMCITTVDPDIDIISTSVGVSRLIYFVCVPLNWVKYIKKTTSNIYYEKCWNLFVFTAVVFFIISFLLFTAYITFKQQKLNESVLVTDTFKFQVSKKTTTLSKYTKS